MKYIVYETTNLVNGKIYIGVHSTKTPYIFDGYLGCGINIHHPSSYKRIKTAFQHAVMKYGFSNFKRKTLAVFDSWEEASNLEAQLVNEDFLAREDVYNMILGGIDDNFFYCIKVYQYDLEGNFIAEHKSMQEAANKYNCDHGAIWHAVYKKQIAKGFLWSTDQMEKLNLSNYNLGLNHQIKISCYDLEGNFITEYKNQVQTSKNTGISIAKIRQMRLLGIPYKDMYFCEVKADNYSKARNEYVNNREVFQYNSNGEFIKKWDSQLEASLEYPTSNINKAIRLKTLCKNNFFWGLEQLKNYNKPINKNTKKQVGKYDLKGNLIFIYDSATAAAKENGTAVWKVLNGTNKTQKGYIYKYIV